MRWSRRLQRCRKIRNRRRAEVAEEAATRRSRLIPASSRMAVDHAAFTNGASLFIMVTTRTVQSGSFHREAWLVSVVLHALLLAGLLPLFQHVPAPIPPVPFRWDVTLVTSPHVEQPAESTAASEIPVEPASSSASALQTPQPSTTSVDRSSSSATLVEEPPAPTVFARAQPKVSPPTPSVTGPTPATQETLPVQRDAAEEPKAMVASTAVETEPSAPVAAPLEQDAPSTPTPSAADVATAPTQPLDTSPERSSLTPSEPSGQPSPSQTDYTWLQLAVSRRLEELKRLSRPSLDDASRHKVLVKAVVSSTGELMKAEVVKSSGLDRIDQEAMTLVLRAFPMLLDHALDRQQIVMRIPITYSRD